MIKMKYDGPGCERIRAVGMGRVCDANLSIHYGLTRVKIGMCYVGYSFTLKLLELFGQKIWFWIGGRFGCSCL